MSQGSGENTNSSQKVIDFNEVRTQKLDEKRRKTERIFFKQLLGVYCVTEQQNHESLKAIEPVDISETGMSFQVPYDVNNPWPQGAEEMTIRLYFSRDNYLPVMIKIVNSKPTIENGVRYVRFGCKVDETVSAYPAYREFVRFLRLYAEHSHQDLGDVTLFYL